MKIGVWHPDKFVLSVKIYTEKVMQHLEKEGVAFQFFKRKDVLPKDVDLFWDSTCTGGRAPHRKLLFVKKPMIATVHGAGSQSLPYHLAYYNKKNRKNSYKRIVKSNLLWTVYRRKLKEIITVSEYAKKELIKYIQLNEAKITPIYHGVDHDIFYPTEEKERNYLLHISVYQPKKNIERLIEAYRLIPEKDRMELKVVAPGYPNKEKIEGLTLITNRIDRQEVATLLQKARAFVFPSIHESFGMPLAEAMACGCPIITSNVTACPEIIGNAGIAVDPMDVEALKLVMLKLINDEKEYKIYRDKSLIRAGDFTWEKTAKEHLKVFQRALQ